MLLCEKKHQNHLNYRLAAPEPPFIRKKIDCAQQTKPRKAT